MQPTSFPSRHLVWLVALMLVHGLMGAATTSADTAESSWSGSIECKLDFETAEYSRHETQTWNITGPATNVGSAMRLYPARWHYTGHGLSKKPGTTAEWNVDTEQEVQLGIVVRASDNKLTIHQMSAGVIVHGALTGTRQVANNKAEPASVFNHAAEQWNFGWIVADPKTTNVTGSLTFFPPALPAGLAPPPNQQPKVNCTWNFTASAGISSSSARALNSPPRGPITADVSRPAPAPSLRAEGKTSPASPPLAPPLNRTAIDGTNPISRIPLTGNYRIILNGFRCNNQTFHDFFSPNGNGDEVYFAAVVAVCTFYRWPGGYASDPVPDGSEWVNPGASIPAKYDSWIYYTSASVVKTDVHGIAAGAVTGPGSAIVESDHIHAGSANAEGGITGGDTFPRDAGSTMAEPVAGSFPTLIWQGQLTDRIWQGDAEDKSDAIIIYPALWKWMGNSEIYDNWASLTRQIDKEAGGAIIELDAVRALRDRLANADLSPFNTILHEEIVYGSLDVASDTGAWATHRDHTIGNGPDVRIDARNKLLDQALHGQTSLVYPTLPLALPGATGDTAFISRAIVVTREAIEEALNSQHIYDATLPPGVIPIHLVDQGSSGNYDLFLRVERVPVAPVTSTNVTTTAAPDGVPKVPSQIPTARSRQVTISGQPPTTTKFPAIKSITPNSGSQWDDRLVVALSAQNTAFLQGATAVDFGPGIQLVAQPPDPLVVVQSSTTLLVSVKIAGDATPGPRTVTITTTGGLPAGLTNGFTVMARDSHEIIQLSPESAQRGQQNLAVTITRPTAYFYPGVGMNNADFGPGISVIGVEFKTEYSVVAHLNIAVSAAPGPRTVTISRSGAGSEDFPGVFTVTP